jgi:hypothetical protein
VTYIVSYLRSVYGGCRSRFKSIGLAWCNLECSVVLAKFCALAHDLLFFRTVQVPNFSFRPATVYCNTFERYLFPLSAVLSAVLYVFVRGFPQSLHANDRTVLQLCHDHLLTNPLQFINHQSLHYSTPWSKILTALLSANRETLCSLVGGYELYGGTYDIVRPFLNMEVAYSCKFTHLPDYTASYSRRPQC